MNRKRSISGSWLVSAIWGLNAFALVGVLVGVGVLNTRKEPVLEQGFLELIPAGTPSRTLQPEIYYLPSVTPNPLTTPIVARTNTPFVLKQGPRPIIIGYSVSGRPLEVYTFGQGERQVMIASGMHGGYERNTIALADELIIYVNDHPEIIPSDAKLFILRNINPDGDARAHSIYGRVNDHGVDLNRNFPENWEKNWDRDGCWNYLPTTGGPVAGSEPETRAVVNFLQSQSVEALISYHSAALGVFPGGEPWEAKSIKLAKALAKVTNYPYPPIDTGCFYTGTLADYAVSLGTTAVDMELRNHRDTDFSQNLKALKVLLDWSN
ncbi:MAG: M14 family metallopeptidase [Anaerolineae bacterium]|nr:M14 family metallopeptidase [Anaerolineae bacterium]MDK1080591.1 M14 family metallopeptidase [Anaerolineae bacterium]MDK1118787.1 M14 family metallopeptidase [Anaerolineae bacterium]